MNDNRMKYIIACVQLNTILNIMPKEIRCKIPEEYLREIEKHKELEGKRNAYILFLNKTIDYPRGSSKIFSIGYSNNLYKTLIKKKRKMEEANLEEKLNIYYSLSLYGAKVFIIENEDELPMNVEYHYVRAFNFFYGMTPRGNYYDSNFKQSRLELKLAKI